MNLENTVLFLIGLLTFWLFQTLIVWTSLHGWIQDDCKAQGPDFIRDNLLGHVAFGAGILMAVLCILVLMDALYFRHHSVLINVLHEVPFLSEYGEQGMLALPLWLGALAGILAGTIVGLHWALSGSTKCRRVLGALFKR
jgi:hypothetical protein